MRHLLFVVLAMVSTLFAADPPKIGSVVTSQMLDPVTVVSYHERGVSLSVLNPETMEVTTSYVVDAPPIFSTTYTDVHGNKQTVTTQATGNSNLAIQTAVQTHQKSLQALQVLYPPAEQ